MSKTRSHLESIQAGRQSKKKKGCHRCEDSYVPGSVVEQRWAAALYESHLLRCHRLTMSLQQGEGNRHKTSLTLKRDKNVSLFQVKENVFPFIFYFDLIVQESAPSGRNVPKTKSIVSFFLFFPEDLRTERKEKNKSVFKNLYN